MNVLAPNSPIDEVDRALIRATQEGLPLCREPYGALAEELGLDAGEVMARLKAMLAQGAIRRLGAVPNHYRLGVTANGMTVWDVADMDVEAAGADVGALPFVTHCYQRPRHPPLWPYNLFAMVHGKSRTEVEDKAKKIAEILGQRARGRDILYSTRILKKTGLRLGD